MSDAELEAFFASVPENRRELVRNLHSIVREEAPDLPIAPMGKWLGYGPYRFRYASGRTGQSARVVLSPGKNEVALHICEGLSGPIAGASTGVGCVRIKNLDRVDIAALRREIRRVATGEPTSLDRSV